MGLEKFHHCCFVHEVFVITDQKTFASLNGQRCGNIITTPTMHYSIHASVQGMHTVPAMLQVHQNVIYKKQQQEVCTCKRYRHILLRGWPHKKRRCGARHTHVLAHQTWVGHDRCCGHKRQICYNIISTTDAYIKTATQPPHGNWEDNIDYVWISVLGTYECW